MNLSATFINTWRQRDRCSLMDCGDIFSPAISLSRAMRLKFIEFDRDFDRSHSFVSIEIRLKEICPGQNWDNMILLTTWCCVLNDLLILSLTMMIWWVQNWFGCWFIFFRAKWHSKIQWEANREIRTHLLR